MNLAPNGKQSNLTDSQYKLVRTKGFKKWFGFWENSPETASKVVDENGEPLVLNRGNLVNQEDLGYTFNLGQNFLKKQSGNKFGFFFTNEIDIAKKYMLVDHFDEIRGGSITSVFMKSNKILDLLDFDLKIGQDNFVQGLIKKGINFNNGYNYLERKILDFNPDNYKYWGYNVFDYFDVFPELRNLFMENGFNSVVFYEMSRTYSKYKVYVAFESNQIKLADGTNTTFDGDNPDIRYNDGGNIPKELYHYTSETNFDRIFDSNILNPSQKYGNRLSFTSDSEYHKKEHGLDYGNTNVRITFDNEKLISDGYSFSPFDHSSKQNKIGKEFEYIISTPIKNVKKYIKNITIFEGNSRLGYIDKTATDDANKYYFNYDIRFDEGGIVGDVFTKKVYFIRLSGGDWFEDYNSVYDDYEDALNDYNKISNSDFDRYENSKGLVKTLSEKTLKYKFVAEIDEDDNIDDYTDTITLKDKTFWQIIDDGEWNVLEEDSVERVNEKADKLLSEVYNYYGRKYNTIYLDKDETISLKLRIADHSGKWKNKGSEDYFLSIVISDKNPTEDFYTNSPMGLNREEEEVFSSENTFEEIIEFINEKIKYYKEEKDIIFKDGGMPKKVTFNSIGSAIGFGTIPIIEGHDMIAECDCGEKFTYQNSKKDILWQCPKCNVKKGF